MDSQVHPAPLSPFGITLLWRLLIVCHLHPHILTLRLRLGNGGNGVRKPLGEDMTVMVKIA